jgi:hypothetical protein
VFTGDGRNCEERRAGLLMDARVICRLAGRCGPAAGRISSFSKACSGGACQRCCGSVIARWNKQFNPWRQLVIERASRVCWATCTVGGQFGGEDLENVGG